MDTVLQIHPLNPDPSVASPTAKPEQLKEDVKSTFEFVSTTAVGIVAIAWSFIWYPVAGALMAPALLLYASSLGAKRIWGWYDDCYSGQKDRFMGDRQADAELPASPPALVILSSAPNPSAENSNNERERRFSYGA